MPRAAWVVCAALLAAATHAFAGPADVPVTFRITTNTISTNSVFVVGNIPQLYNWDATHAVKLVPTNCVGSNCSWSVQIGIPPGVAYQYKFIKRPDCALCYANSNNASWEPGTNRTDSTLPGQPPPYAGKTVFYYSSWTNVWLQYSNPAVGFANKAMSAVGEGRTNLFPKEKIWRVEGINTAGDPNWRYSFYTVIAGTNLYDNAGMPGVDYRTPLDAFAVQDGQVYNYWPPPLVSSNRVEQFTLFPTNGLTNRPVYVYLPRGYNENVTKRYPVLYMHDGQDLFLGMTNWISGHGWKADTTASNLVRFGQMRETIIVGVSSDPDRTSQRRLCEYSPPLLPPCTNMCTSPLGAQYASLLLDQLKPIIDTKYRTLTNADDTGVMGASMGGLISKYLGCAFTNTFHKVGAMSSPHCDCHPAMAVEPVPNQRIYLDSGDTNGPGNRCLINDGLLATMAERDNLLNRGYVLNSNLDHTIGLHQTHDESWWALRLPRPFTFLFPTLDEPNTVLDSVAPPRITHIQIMGESNIVTWTAYKARTYSLEASPSLSKSMNWSNVFTTPTPEALPWNYISAPATNTFRFFRVRELPVPNWPN
jgi:predicted alpha/beta superfamily hydrolase